MSDPAGPTADPPAAPHSTRTHPHPTDPGTTLALPPCSVPFTDLTPHARGGLGEVYRGTDPDLHRTVAVKCLQDRHARNADSRRRFLLEAEITARLEHPGVVSVYGLYAGGDQPAYAMRFVEGQTLAEAIAGYHAGRPDPVAFRRLLQSFLQVCQTVAYAHSRGVIHRDLKPANVMLGQFGVTLVVDWGLAKVVGRPEDIRASGVGETLIPSEADSEPGETAMGSAIGTPAFMSPEQAAGRWDVVAQPADIYSLGAVLYTLLTGKPPLEKGNWPEMQQRIQRGDFPRPRQQKPAVPRGLEAICLKAMALDPPARYSSAEALAADIEHWMADEPVAARRDGLTTRTRRWAKRNRTLVSGAAVLLVTALVAAGVGLGVLGKKNREVASERNAARLAADEAGAVNDFLTEDLLGQADPDSNSRDKKVTVEELLNRAGRKIDGNPKFADKPQIEATLRMTIGKTYYKLGQAAEAVRHLRRALDLRRAHLPTDDSRTLAAQNALAEFLLRGLENPAEAEPLAKQTWEARKRVLGPAHRDTLDSLDIYASAVQGLGHKDEALALMRECMAGRRAVLPPDDPDTLDSMNNVAVLLIHRGEWMEANKLLREVVVFYERNGMVFESFGSPGNLGHNLYFLGELDEAEKILAHHAGRAARQLSPDHMFTHFLRSFLAKVWVEQGKADRAVETLNELIADRRNKFPKGDWRTASYLLELGRAKLALGKPDEAADALEEARRMYRSFPPPNDYYAPWADACHGIALVALGKYAEAEPLLLAAEVRLRGMVVCPKRHYRQSVEQLAKLYDAWGRPADAAVWRAQLIAPVPPKP